MATSTKIFISYRRDDSAATCGHIYERLVARFGKDAVFIDVENITYGADFEQVIRNILVHCGVQLVVIGPHWMDGLAGRQQHEAHSDYVRLEIEAALKQQIQLLPVLVQGARMPDANDLPETLRPLTRFNAVPVRYYPDFDSDMRRLIGAIEQLLGIEFATPLPVTSPIPVPPLALVASMHHSFAAKDWLDVMRKADLLIRTMPQAATAEVYRLLGMAALELREDKRASDALDVALKQEPLHVPTMRAAAQAHLHLGHSTEAAALLADALALSSDRAERLAILSEYVEALAGLKRWGDLLANADEALLLAPDDPMWLTQRLRALTELGRQQEALEVLRRLTSRPEATAVQWLARARLEVDTQRYADAQNSLAAAQRLAPADMAVARTRDELFPLPEVPPRLIELGFRGVSLARTAVILPPVVPVPIGEFLMGSDNRRDSQVFDNELLQHRVPLGIYQIAKYPLTVAEYACFVRAGHRESQTFNNVTWQTQLRHLDHPVVCVTWYDAMAYAAWLARLTGQPWRLLTEAEWEKAARGPDGLIYPWGNQWDKTRANTNDGGPRATTPVGHYSSGASPYGALDMAGNVWEWTSSLFKPYPYTPTDGRENVESTGDRVLRGGSWQDSPRLARVAYRNNSTPDDFVDFLGFRLVLVAAVGV